MSDSHSSAGRRPGSRRGRGGANSSTGRERRDRTTDAGRTENAAPEASAGENKVTLRAGENAETAAPEKGGP